jgi:primary-amine oxidase
MKALEFWRILLVAPFLAWSLAAQGAAQHPLDALDAAEITVTTAILRSAGHVDDKTLIASLTLQEPHKGDVLAWKAGDPIERRAKAVLRRHAATFEAVVDLGSKKVLSHKEIPGAQPMLTLPEILSAMEITIADPRMRESLQKRGITDLEKLFCAPRTAGNFGAEIERTRRIVKMDCFDIRGVHSDVFANPIEGLYATVDLDRREVLVVTDLGIVPVPGGNSELDPASTGVRADVKPVIQTSPAGSNIAVNGSMFRWQKWSFHLRWELHEGVVVSLVSFQDGDRQRSVLYQGHLSEIFVP